ncbi:hypothetical protein LRY65_02910 [Candidatus Woesebacteria bacterium]|nr:hypothetical protein [Candidatus Woesebacteria bacterium]MCD8507719.1 hypothetical protein [Candidatus Woesebacteria bacterium]MCD8527141.1 hypothetical protein [Candidatus Woesebacteria bacterium]MCD8546822.1 hypothetical protein [Candidatus Woesebacteria bacterium]
MAKRPSESDYEAPIRNLGAVGNTLLGIAFFGTVASIGIQEANVLPPNVDQAMFFLSLGIGGLGIAAKTGKRITEENR